MEEQKEIKRNTAACEICKKRKQKCDGKAPCSFCVSRNIECKFSEQKKRGPAKKRSVEEVASPGLEINKKLAVTTFNFPPITPVPHHLEGELLDKAEARHYITVYHRFEHHRFASPIETLLAPPTVAHKVQSYVALADGAQFCGDFIKGKLYIAQARQLSGSIFDHVDTDTVKGFLMMRKHFFHTLDITQCAHYANVAWSLAKLLKGKIEDRLKLSCQLAATMTDFDVPVNSKLTFLRNTVNNFGKQLIAGTLPRDDLLFYHVLKLAGEFLEHFNLNIFHPYDGTLSSTFKEINSVRLSQETRLRMLQILNELQIAATTLRAEEHSVMVIMNKIFCPTYQTLINWRSGNITEALSSAIMAIQAFDRIARSSDGSANFLVVVTGNTHFCLIASVLQFLMEQGQAQLAASIETHLRNICSVRGPEYNSILESIEEFKSQIGVSTDFASNYTTDSSSNSSDPQPITELSYNTLDIPTPTNTYPQQELPQTEFSISSDQFSNSQMNFYTPNTTTTTIITHQFSPTSSFPINILGASSENAFEIDGTLMAQMLNGSYDIPLPDSDTFFKV